ncbi:MAG: N-acetylmuramoyl-L-alanine amidase [Chloroflexi bacterium]|nr:N-acetylmuramoyl-L-alanine amidase [Chloroflexota bacterium]
MIRRELLEYASSFMLLTVITVTISMMVMAGLFYLGPRAATLLAFGGKSIAASTSTLTSVSSSTVIPASRAKVDEVEVQVTLEAQAGIVQESTVQAVKGKIGIVAGHWKSDSGAVCPDGLQEAQINLSVAQKVVSALISRGYSTELLAEFDPRISGFVADAFLSIHSDSCVTNVSGFKISRFSLSKNPTVDDRLVNCLYTEYGKATGLPRHEATVTLNMLHYHGLRDKSPETPGAIIELGFLGSNRDVLTGKQDVITNGLVNGLTCFLQISTAP